MDDENLELTETLAEIDRQGSALPAWFTQQVDGEISKRLGRTFEDMGNFRLVGDAAGLTLVSASAFSKGMRPGSSRAVSCMWLQRTRTNLPETPEVVEFFQEFRGECASKLDKVIAFVPFIAERSVARALLLKAIDEEPEAELYLVSLEGISREIDLVAREILQMTRKVVTPLTISKIDALPNGGWAMEPEKVLATEGIDVTEFIPSLCLKPIRDANEYLLDNERSVEHQRKRDLEAVDTPTYNPI